MDAPTGNGRVLVPGATFRPDAERLAAAWRGVDRDPVSVLAMAEALLTQTPGNADATLLLAAARRRLGQVQAARTVLAPLMTPTIRNPAAWFEYGMVLFAAGEEARAADALRQAVSVQPAFAAGWRTLGDMLMVLGEGPAAGAAYARAAQAGLRDPALAEAARALCDGREALAERLMQAHLLRSPGDVRAMHLQAAAAARVGHGVAAIAMLEACLALAPGFAEARHSLAVLHYALKQFDHAAGHFRVLLAAAPQLACLRVLLSVCLVETGDYAGAIPLFEAALAAYRAQPKIWLQYAHALKTVGRADEAVAAYRVCIALAPSWCAGAYLSLADVKTAVFSDDELAAMKAYLARPGLGVADAGQLHYALGRALEQRGDFAAAFSHFAAGARARRSGIRYDADATDAYVAASTAVFTAGFFAARRQGGCQSDAPIFVVGMPRSGSTLVEQILASHSAVEGTAELDEIGAIAAELRAGRPAVDLPGIVAGLDEAARTRLGERYIEKTRQFRRTNRPRFIDKMPDNFLHAGLIAVILPRARIVDVRRAPMAAGFAAFKQYFQSKQTGADYTFDLAEIGRYTRSYMALMAGFAAARPGLAHLVRYERLVADTEPEVRALLAACGLDFEPACLRFWETDRAVQTPSAQQVRQPIFRDGLTQWRRYEAWLGPLRAALGKLAEETDDFLSGDG